MQLESQVLVREFNRRLRGALTGVPNHVRVEAALEVESHVEDVLSHRPSDLPEPERVAQILSGFGTPEEYAGAIVNQLPPVQVVTVTSGLREIGMAGRDLLGGLGRLALAVLRGSGRFTVMALRTAVHLLAEGARLLGVGLKQIDAWSAEPRAAAGRWWRGSLREKGVTLRSLDRNALRAVVWLFHTLELVARWAIATGTGLGRFAWEHGRVALRWGFRTALMLGLAALALAALLLAGFSAAAPDLVGWKVYETQQVWANEIELMRERFLSNFSPAYHSQFVQTGLVVQVVALSLGLGLSALAAYMFWSGRRRRAV